MTCHYMTGKLHGMSVIPRASAVGIAIVQPAILFVCAAQQVDLLMLRSGFAVNTDTVMLVEVLVETRQDATCTFMDFPLEALLMSLQVLSSP